MGKKKMVRKGFTLTKDLVDWCDSQDNASYEARQALKFYIKYKDSREEIEQAITFYRKYQQWMEQKFLNSKLEFEPSQNQRKKSGQNKQIQVANNLDFDDNFKFEEKETKVDFDMLEGNLDKL